MSSLPPRAVLVTRATELEALLADHGTRGAAAFFLRSREQRIEDVDARHRTQQTAADDVLAQIPLEWRRARVDRDNLDRFLFEPSDIVVTVGQDGLVANVAKYLERQVVVGIHPGEQAGVLAPHASHRAGVLLEAAQHEAVKVQSRTLVCARTKDGQELCALNEIFIGHRSHQSARYTLEIGGRSERQSSSGILVSSGTGATGWAKSVTRGREGAPPLPSPEERRVAYLVREAWPSPNTGCELVHGLLEEGESLRVRSEMNEGGVLFGDGVERDFIPLPYGERAQVQVAERCLRLLV